MKPFSIQTGIKAISKDDVQISGMVTFELQVNPDQPKNVMGLVNTSGFLTHDEVLDRFKPHLTDRVVLFLQGPPTPFWVELGDAVAARGARVLRVNLNAADALFWPRRGALNYRGSLKRWRRWLADLVARDHPGLTLDPATRFGQAPATARAFAARVRG